MKVFVTQMGKTFIQCLLRTESGKQVAFDGRVDAWQEINKAELLSARSYWSNRGKITHIAPETKSSCQVVRRVQGSCLRRVTLKRFSFTLILKNA